MSGTIAEKGIFIVLNQQSNESLKSATAKDYR